MSIIKTICCVLLGVLSLFLVVVNGLIPFVWITEFTAPYIYSMLSGADPIITAYLENALFAIPLLLMAMGFFGVAAFQFFRRSPRAARSVIMAEGAIIVSLFISDHVGMTKLHFNPGELPILITAMAALVVSSLWATRPSSV